MKHKAIRKDNLMYKGCEPHWQCVICGDCVPFHCWSKEEYEQQECKHGLVLEQRTMSNIK